PVAGGTLTTIAADRVIIARPEGPLDVRLRDPGKPRPAPTAAAPPGGGVLTPGGLGPGVVGPGSVAPGVQAQPPAVGPGGQAVTPQIQQLPPGLPGSMGVGPFGPGVGGRAFPGRRLPVPPVPGPPPAQPAGATAAAPPLPPPPTAPEVPPAMRGRFIVLNFDNADIETVIQAASEIVGFNYVLGPGVSGKKVTVQTSGRVAQEDVFGVLLAILEVSGVTAVKAGNLYKIVTIEGARARAVPTIVGAKPDPTRTADEIITQIVPLRYTSV